MTAPDKIYIEIDNKAHVYFGLQPENAVEYIRKDALMEWLIEQRDYAAAMDDHDYDVYAAGEYNAYQEMIDKLNSM